MEQVVVDVGDLQIDKFVIVALRQSAGARRFLNRVLRYDPVSRCHI